MQSEYLKLIKKLPDIISSNTVEHENYKITYKELTTSPTSPLDKTVYKPISVLVKIENKLTGEAVEQAVTLLNAPAETNFGFKIGGNYYTAMGIDKRACGWYIAIQERGGQKGLTLEFIPQSGMKIFIIERNKEVQVFLGSKNNYSRRVNLGIFLKAVLGKSYTELSSLLGIRNRYVSSTFIREESRDSCVSQMLSHIMKNSSELSADYKYKELTRRLHDKHYLNPGNSYSRTKRNTSFLERAVGCVLAEDVLGYKKGITLTESILQKIDSSDLDTLLVEYNHRVYELKKYNIDKDFLSEGELLTMVNMYMCALDGFPTENASYELTNRRTQTFSCLVGYTIEERLDKISEKVGEFFREKGTRCNVAEFKMPRFHVDELIEQMKSSDSPIVQSSEMINGISLASKFDKIVSDLKGRGGEKFIAVKSTEKCLYDGLQQPESKKVGYVYYKTLTAKVDDDGVLKGTFIKFENGEPVNPTGEPVYLNAYEIKTHYIAPWDADMSKEMVACFYNGRTELIPRSCVEYQEWSPLNNLSLPTALIPFANFAAGKRITMGDNFQKQAVKTINNERPLVSTGVCGYYDLGIIRAREVLIRYYQEHFNVISMSYEEFIELPLKLISTDTSVPGYRTLFFTIPYKSNTSDTTDIAYVIPHCKRTIEDTLSEWTIQPSPREGYIYQGDDILVSDATFDIKKYNLIKYLDLGYMDTSDESKFNHDVAYGVNLRVGYKIFDSTTVDDSITICSSLLGTGKLAHIAVQEFKATLRKYDDATTKDKFCVYGDLPGFDSNGLPKVGTYLKPRSVVISRVIEANGDEKPDPIRLDSETEGEVMLANISKDGTEATVYVAHVAEIALGDKVCGSYGNKGVIAYITPESQMPFTEDGKPLDIILNPEGVPSRMNLAQFIENRLGLAARLMGKDVGFVVTPQYRDSLKIYNKYSKELKYPWSDKSGLYATTIYDGRTGLPFPRKINYGWAYIKKLRHVATSKSNATGINLNVNQETGQPRKGKKVAGGQTIGEMETWGYLATGAYRFLQELFSFQSDDISTKKRLGKNVEAQINDCECPVLKGENNNDSALVTLPRLMGVDIQTVDNKYVLKPMTDKDICSLASKPMDLNANALQDETYFGVTKSPTSIAITRKIWGYMPLNCEIVNPLWIYEYRLCKMIMAYKLERDVYTGVVSNAKYTTLNSKFVRNVIKTQVDKNISKKDRAYLAFKGKTVFFTSDPTIAGYEWETGMSAVVKAFKCANLSDTWYFYYNQITKRKSKGTLTPEDEFDYLELMSTIDYIKQEYGDLTFVILRHLPVIPITYRQPAMGRQANFDILYTSIINAACDNQTADRSTLVYMRYLDLLGIDNHVKLKKNCMTALTKFTGKNSESADGAYRDNVMSKVVDCSLRAAITPSQTNLLRIIEIGIPYKKALICLRTFILPMLISAFDKVSSVCKTDESLDEFYSAVMLKDSYKLKAVLKLNYIKQAEDLMQEIISLVTDFCENRVVVAGRQPTLYKFGLRAFMIKLVEGDALKIHPVVCAAYNADFDGDQMHAEFPLTQESMNEVFRLMSPANDFIDPKDDSFILEPTQDTILGCYLMTMLKNNVVSVDQLPDYYCMEKIQHYKSLAVLRYDIEFQRIEPYQLIHFTHPMNHHSYISTAGRILFNTLFPGGFTDKPFSNPLGLTFVDTSKYCDLKFDGLIKKGRNDKYLHYYDDPSNLKNDVKEKNIKPLDMVSYYDVSTRRKYLDVASRLIENLDDGLTDTPVIFNDILTGYYALRNQDSNTIKINSDSLLRTISIKDVTKSIYTTLNGMDTCECIDKIFQFGSIYSDRLGISLSLEDFVQHPHVDKLVANADKFVKTIHKHYNQGLISESGRIESTSKIYNILTNYVKDSLLDYYDRNNNLFIMIDSGARGNLSQLAQSCGLIGTVARTSDEELETPVLSNYGRGLTSHEQTLISYGTRMGVSGTQNNTADAGALTRTAAYTLSGIRVVEHNCGAEDSMMKVIYSKDFYQVLLDDKEIDITEIIDSEISSSDEEYEHYISLGSNLLTPTNLYYIQKNHIRTLKLVNGSTVKFKYKLTRMFRNMMKHRVAKDLPFLETSSVDHNQGIMTSRALDYIEEQNLIFIKVRTMLTCHSEGGVCAKCFGIDPSTNMFPKVGTEVGIIAAQALGEPATQLVLERINNGGKSDSGLTSGVKVFQSYMAGSVPGNPKENPRSAVASCDGYVYLSELGKDFVKLDLGDQSIKVKKDSLVVKDREYVHRGDFLTDAVLDVNQIKLADDEETLRRRQIELLTLFYNIFSSNSIDLNVRIFEVMVRAQLSLVRILESNSPDFVPGHFCFKAKLDKARQQDPNLDVRTYMKVEHANVIISQYSGPICNLVNGYFARNLALNAIIPNRQDSNQTSSLTKLAVGENLVTHKIKHFNTLKYVNGDVADIKPEQQEIEKMSKLLNFVDPELDNFENDKLASLDLSSLLDVEEDEDERVDDIQEEVATDEFVDNELDSEDNSDDFNVNKISVFTKKTSSNIEKQSSILNELGLNVVIDEDFTLDDEDDELEDSNISEDFSLDGEDEIPNDDRLNSID